MIVADFRFSYIGWTIIFVILHITIKQTNTIPVILSTFFIVSYF